MPKTQTSSLARTPEGDFWRGTFGDAYIERNAPTEERVRSRVAMWARIFQSLHGAMPDSILEVGANVGVNLAAIQRLCAAELHAIEPNAAARNRLAESGILPKRAIHDGLATQIGRPDTSIDLVFTSGVLIHIAPKNLAAACHEMARVSKRYLVSIEYFSEREEEVSYRGHEGKLFKRDFGSFWLDNVPDLQVVDYGFFWRRVTGLDNLTWWLFRKP